MWSFICRPHRWHNCLNHPSQPPTLSPSMENLSSTKLAPSTRKVGNHWFKPSSLWSFVMAALTNQNIEETGCRVYRNYLYYLHNFPVKSKTVLQIDFFFFKDVNPKEVKQGSTKLKNAVVKPTYTSCCVGRLFSLFKPLLICKMKLVVSALLISQGYYDISGINTCKSNLIKGHY